MRCYVTVSGTIKGTMEKNGLSIGSAFGYPEVYTSEELAMKNRCSIDTHLAELEIAEEDVQRYASGVYIVNRDITTDNVIGFKPIDVRSGDICTT